MRRYVRTTTAAEEIGFRPATLRTWARRYDYIKPALLILPSGHYRWDVEELRRILADDD